MSKPTPSMVPPKKKLKENTSANPEKELTVDERRAIVMENADKILEEIQFRKDKILELLSQVEYQPNWSNVRNSCISVHQSGQPLANPVITNLFSQAEPLLHKFQDDLSVVKVKICLLLSAIDKEEGQSAAQDNPNSPANQFLVILKVIGNMSGWAGTVQQSWVGYHVSRLDLVQDPAMGIPQAQDLLDKGRALAVWDCKMAGEIRSTLNVLLHNYIALEDIAYRAVKSIGHTRASSLWKIYS